MWCEEKKKKEKGKKKKLSNRWCIHTVMEVIVTSGQKSRVSGNKKSRKKSHGNVEDEG
jgi:hypothetical protein